MNNPLNQLTEKIKDSGLGHKARIFTVVAGTSIATLFTSCSEKSEFEQKSDAYVKAEKELVEAKKDLASEEQDVIDTKNELIEEENDVTEAKAKVKAATIQYQAAKRNMQKQANKE